MKPTPAEVANIQHLVYYAFLALLKPLFPAENTNMKFSKYMTPLFTLAFIFASFLQTHLAHAGGHESAGGASAYTKLEPLTVNLQGLSQYLQVSITLKGATPEAGEAISAYMPMIRHALILLLSSKDAAQISTLEGKTSLGNETRIAVNKAIGMTDKQGVSGILFQSFIIQ